MKHLAIITSSLLLLISSLSAAVPLRWTVETSRAQPATFEAYQGETIEFEAALQSYGKPLEAPVQYAFYWQTNGMGSAYWSAPCTVTGASSPRGADTNLLRATWLPTYDVGARAYNCFIGLSNSIYHAAFQLRLRPSPGAVPNELPLPQKVIDFSQVTVLNPPWSGGGSGGVDTNAVIDITTPLIATATNDLNTTLTNAISMKRDLTDLDVYAINSTNGWTFTYTKDGLPYVPVRPMFEYKHPKWCETIEDLISMDPDYAYGYWEGPGWYLYASEAYILVSSEREPIDTIEIQDEDNGADFIFYELHLTYNVKGRIVRVPDRLVTTNDLFATVRSATNDLATTLNDTISKKADEFTQWECFSLDEMMVVVWVTNGWFFVYGDKSYSDLLSTNKNAVFLQGYNGDTATRKRVLRTGEAATPQQVMDAISTNNPAFVSAVRSTPPDPDTPWGTYGTLGAAIAGIIAALANKLTKGLDDDGVPTDANVQELFSESNTSLVQAVDAKAATSAANIPDRGVAVVDGSSGTAASKQTVTVSFAAAKGTELRMCELLITDVAEDDAVTVSLPAGTYQFADGADATKKADGNHFIFTEYARGCWFVNSVSTTESEVA